MEIVREEGVFVNGKGGRDDAKWGKKKRRDGSSQDGGGAFY